MTLVAALILGLLGGFVVRGARRAATAALIPWLAVLTFQTWLIGSGHGNNRTSTVNEAGYWMVQLIAVALCLGIAAVIASLRARRTAPRHDATETVRR